MEAAALAAGQMMYERFFGLSEPPFELTPDPKYLFLTLRHQEALSNLQYGLASAKAITVLIGEAGTGKTTLLHAAAQSDRCRNVTCVYLNNSTLTRAEFVEALSHRFHLGPAAAESKAALLEALERVLRERRDRGQITALVIDEAQSLSVELLEEIRLLANVETSTEKLLPLVLSGQPELRDRLNLNDLRQLKQRITLRCEIAAFNVQETAAYISARVRIAGGDAAKLFTREAVRLIHDRSRGIPRTVSVMCDNALVSAFALGRRRVDQDIVTEVARDFDYGEAVLDSGALLARRDAATDSQRDPLADQNSADPPAATTTAGAEDEAVDADVKAHGRRFSLFKGY
jgi:general secretion pathway protein A